MPSNIKKSWVVDVSMGYGHQRTAYPLQQMAYKDIISVDTYKGVPDLDRAIWKNSKEFYHAVSRFGRVPIIGDIVFDLFNEVQKINPYYPKRDLSKLGFFSKIPYNMIKGIPWGKDFVQRISKKKIPFVSTFFTASFMAEEFNYPGEIYTVVCDTDISRAWVAKNPQNSRIKYFAPTSRVVGRLISYGVPEKNIYLTGYPLPKENIGDRKLKILKQDILNRLPNLNPNGKYLNKYGAHVTKHLGRIPKKSDHKLTLMFAVGGAGAQKEMAIQIIEKLKERILAKELNFILIAGSRKEVYQYFKKELKELNLGKQSNIEIVYNKNTREYFKEFNKKFRKTDILFTKPSELSFYSALGVPIVIMEPIGYQENFNQEWLLRSGFGILPGNLEYINEWLFDFIDTGFLADACIQAFVEGRQTGTFEIQDIISKRK